MATQAQIDANRLNAKKSTGPRTPEGKATSSRNSLLHGLTAAKHFLPDEDPAGPALLLEDLRAEWKPNGPTQELLVERMAVASWRLRRFVRVEAGLFNLTLESHPIPEHRAAKGCIEPASWAFRVTCFQADEFTKLARYEAHLQREFRDCLHELQKLKSLRNADAMVDTMTSRFNQADETNPISQASRPPAPAAPTAASMPEPQPASRETKPNPKNGQPAPKPETIHRPAPKIGRNDPCPCGSATKYKRCCDLGAEPFDPVQ
jgi:hypothetical protein